VTSDYYQLIFSLIAIWALFAIAWNLFSGLTGLISFGHAMFFGTGAYVTALMFARYGLTPIIGIPAGCIAAIAISLMVGRITFGLRGHYFALAMLTFPISAMYVADWLGLQEVVLPLKRESPSLYLQFDDHRILTAMCAISLLLTILLCLAVQNSRFGLALQALRQNEAAAEASGLPAFRLRMVAIAISAGLSAFAGGLYAVLMLVITPASTFGLPVSAQVLIISMFGGIGTVWGPLLGAAILVPLTEVLSAEFGAIAPGVQGLLLGAAIISVMLFMPAGLLRGLKLAGVKRLVAGPNSTIILRDTTPMSVFVKPADDRCELLRIANISVRFGGVYALHGVSLSVNKHEILGIIGPNGAGKTTLFNVVSGFTQSSDGNVSFGEHNLGRILPDGIARLGVGRTFQAARPFPEMSTFENVLVGTLAGGFDLKESLSFTERAINAVGLSSRAHTETAQLSNFELRLVELARVLVSRPEIILLDEPFAGVARSEIDLISSVLVELRDAGLGIVVIDHTVPALRKFVDRIVVLDHGEVIADGLPEDVLTMPIVLSAYLGTEVLLDADM
jgi:branched-chain amino acid transport system permease protein